MLKSLLIGVLSMPSFCISKLFQSGPQTDFRTRRGKFRAPKARAVRGIWGTDTLTGEGANFRTYSTTVGLSFKEIIFLVTLGNYCLKLGQVNVPLSPVLLFKIWRGHFPRARRAKIRQASPPPLWGEWYEYTISGVTTSRATSGERRKDRNTSGQRGNKFNTSQPS